MKGFITAFEHLDFKMLGIIDAFFWECFVSGIKDEIQAQVLMDCHKTWLKYTNCTKEAQQVVFS